MINYSIAEFLGIFLIAVPVFFFATIIWIVGLRWIVDRFDDTKKVFFHHFHYKDRREPAEPRGSRKRNDWL